MLTLLVVHCVATIDLLWAVPDEWQVAERRYFSEGWMAKLYESDNDEDDQRSAVQEHRAAAG